MILLISPQDTLVEACAAMLPTSIPLVHLAAIPETESYLNAQTDDAPEPALILLDIEAGYEAIAECRQLYQKSLAAEPPLVVLISNPANLQKVLEAGADDYLLLPLVPSEVRVRLTAQKLFHVQEEAQVRAMQNAFVMLIARMISEQPDINTTLSQALELTIPLLNASGGDIWLFSTDGQWLELVSSLSSQFSGRQIVRRAKGQGLVGWVAEQGRYLQIHVPTNDPRFEPQVDQIEGIPEYYLLAVPLRHHETTTGVLSIYKDTLTPFTNQDEVLLEGIAGLTTSAIANAQLLQELRDYSNQQQVLYEMSQQIAAGLDLPAILKRSLYWIGRLIEVEAGFLWLVKEDADALYLAAALGVDLPPGPPLEQPFKQGINGWVAHSGEAIIVNDPANEPRLDKTVFDTLQIALRNVMIAPMTYHNQLIGALNLVNKIGDPFEQADLTLLRTAIEMVAVAVSNANLHTRAITLMNERERLHRQILQSERLATMGRLTATLSHEINNPMQAIQGALALALEELDNPEEVAAYLQMCQTESARVVRLLNRMRRVYRPQESRLVSLDLNQALQEAIALARKELKRQKVKLQTDLAPNLPRLTAVVEQLHLVFLSLLLNWSDAIGAAEGGELQLRSYASSEMVRIEFSTRVSNVTLAGWEQALKPDLSQGGAEINFGLSLSYDIIVAHGGAINLSQEGEQTICRIEFSLSPPADLSASLNKRTI